VTVEFNGGFSRLDASVRKHQADGHDSSLTHITVATHSLVWWRVSLPLVGSLQTARGLDPRPIKRMDYERDDASVNQRPGARTSHVAKYSLE
jgi:hypothetical protein